MRVLPLALQSFELFRDADKRYALRLFNALDQQVVERDGVKMKITIDEISPQDEPAKPRDNVMHAVSVSGSFSRFPERDDSNRGQCMDRQGNWKPAPDSHFNDYFMCRPFWRYFWIWHHIRDIKAMAFLFHDDHLSKKFREPSVAPMEHHATLTAPLTFIYPDENGDFPRKP
jgi:hypothetical protein